MPGNRPSRHSHLLGAALILALAATSPAANLLLDFGAGAPVGAATGADALVSPGHQAGGLAPADNFWNYVDATSVTGLTYSDGTTPATGVTVTTRGETANGTNIIDFETGRTLNTGSVTGSAAQSDTIYSGNRPGRNGVFVISTNATNNAAVGTRISGLAAGTYNIYVTGRNTNQAGSAHPTSFYLTSAPGTPGTYDFTSPQLTAGVTHTTGSFADTTYAGGQGDTYVAFENVTLAEGGSFLLASEGTSAAEFRGFLSSIEVVLIPEPSAAALILATLGLFALRRRRA